MYLHFSPSEWAEIAAAARLCGAPDVETFVRDAIQQAVDEVLDDASTLPMLRIYDAD